MTKGKKVTLISFLAVFAVLAAVFLTFDLVVFVTPASLGEINGRWSHPGFLNPGYFCITRSDDSVSFLERLKTAVATVYMPYSTLSDGTKCSFYTVERNGEMSTVGFSEEKMYASFLSSFPKRMTGLVYEENSSVKDVLTALSPSFPSLASVTYADRVNVVNVDALKKTTERMWALIIPDPSSSALLYRDSSCRIVMAEMDAVGAVSLPGVISLHYDWKRMIASDFTPYYTFSVLH